MRRRNQWPIWLAWLKPRRAASSRPARDQSAARRSAEDDVLRSGLLRLALASYARRGWTVLLHLGAQRRTSTRLRRLARPAGGYAGIAGRPTSPGTLPLLDACERGGGTIADDDGFLASTGV